jgi:hypothetical protein
MADLTYAEQQALDDAGAKFFAALVDNGGVNEFTAIGGTNRRLQNGEPVVDMDVNVTNQVSDGVQLDHYTLNTAAAEQSLTVDSTVGGVQFAAFHASTTHVLISMSGGPEIRFTLRGGAPTSSTGHRLFAHGTWIMEKAMAAAAKFIRGYSATADGKLYLTELIEHRILTGTT